MRGAKCRVLRTNKVDESMTRGSCSRLTQHQTHLGRYKTVQQEQTSPKPTAQNTDILRPGLIQRTSACGSASERHFAAINGPCPTYECELHSTLDTFLVPDYGESVSDRNLKPRRQTNQINGESTTKYQSAKVTYRFDTAAG